MTDSKGFHTLVPGFEFLQDLVKNAGAALPGMGQWIAPTLNPEDLEKRIDELKTVQFWLEQNARMLAATIQALEVQRMTLSTLKNMNVQMGDLREAMTLKMPDLKPAARQPEPEPPAPAPAPTPASPPVRERTAQGGGAESSQPEPGQAKKPPAAGIVDPMQWWGALTQQFTQLAASAMKESGAGLAKNLVGALQPGQPSGADAAPKAASAKSRSAAAPSAAAGAPVGQATSKAVPNTARAAAPARKRGTVARRTG